jgi:hypothetical protein
VLDPRKQLLPVREKNTIAWGIRMSKRSPAAWKAGRELAIIKCKPFSFLTVKRATR